MNVTANEWPDELDVMRLCDEIRARLFEAHRGVILHPEGDVAYVFGNDGFDADRTRDRIARFVAAATAAGFPCGPRQASTCGGTWCVPVRVDGFPMLDDAGEAVRLHLCTLLWEASIPAAFAVPPDPQACLYVAAQMRVADEATAGFEMPGYA